MKAIDEDIKNGQIKKIYLLYGEEAYLKHQYKNKLKSELLSQIMQRYGLIFSQSPPIFMVLFMVALFLQWRTVAQD